MKTEALWGVIVLSFSMSFLYFFSLASVNPAFIGKMYLQKEARWQEVFA